MCNKSRWIFASFLILCLFWVQPPTARAASQDLKVGVVPYTTPYMYLERNKIVGANIDIFNKIALNLGMATSYVPFDNYAEATSALESGEIDALLGVSLGEKKSSYLIYSSTIIQDSVSMMTRGSQPARYQYLFSTDPYSAAVEKGIALSSEFIPLPNMNCWMCATTDEAFGQFNRQKLDYLIAPRASLLRYVNGSGGKAYTLSNSYITTIHYGVALPSSNTSLLHSINNEIMQLKVSGDIDQILGRWIPKESVSNRVFQNFLLGFLVLCIFATGIIVIFAKFNAYLKEQVACKTQSLQLLNEDLQKQILTVRNTNELRMLLIENNAEGVVVFTRENRITIFNEKALRVTQLKYAPIGLDVFQVPLLDQLLEDVKSHIYSPVHLVNEIKRIPDGSGQVRIFRYNLFPLFTADQQVRAMTLTFDDVTEQTRLENELYEQEKSKSLTRIVAGMAHEIRNPLTSIKTFIELLPAQEDNPEFKDTFLEIVPGEIERINRLITNLLEYAKPTQMAVRPVEVGPLLHSTCALLSHGFAQKGVSLDIQYQEGVYIQADEQRLKQILINFLLNSLDAVLAKPDCPDRIIRFTATATGETVHLLVEDPGIGMDEEELKSAVEPFYSTKWNGTGLGLYIAQRYAQENGASLYIESEKNVCTKVHLTFARYWNTETGEEHEKDNPDHR